MANGLVGIRTKDFQLATAFGTTSVLAGFEGAGDPGSERRYPRALLDALYANGGNDYFVPEAYGAIGNGIADDTAALDDMLADIASVPVLGNAKILIRPEKCYACNWTIDHDNLEFFGFAGYGDADILSGFTAFNTSQPTITLGSTARQLRNIRMRGIRVYSKTKGYGMLIQSCAYGRFYHCEFGGYQHYALKLKSGGAGANVYYNRFIACSIFGTSSSVGDLLDLSEYGTGFCAGNSFNGCDMDGSAVAGGHVIRVGTNQVIRIGGGTWIQALHNCGIAFQGGGCQIIVDGDAMLDSGNSNDTLLEWPSAENSPNSFVVGGLRVDGFGRRGDGTLYDLKGVFGGGHGFYYGPTVFRPRMIGAVEHIDTGSAVLSGPLSVVGGGPPSALDPDGNAWKIASSFRSTNNGGSSNTEFLYTDGGFENVISGGYVGHVGPNLTIASSAIDLSTYKGNHCYVDGTGTLQFLGNPTGPKRPDVYLHITSTFILKHTAYPGPGITVTGYNRNITLASGDIILVHSESGGSSPNFWRVMMITTGDNRVL